MAFYLDTSALVKLVVAEAESTALREWMLRADAPLATGRLAHTELVRAVRRADASLIGRARDVTAAVHLLDLTDEVFESAALLGPPELRSLDALHLATALRLGADLRGIVTYDERLATAAAALGMTVIAPA